MSDTTAPSPESAPTAGAPAPRGNPSHARGTLAGKSGEEIIFAIPETNYELLLSVLREPSVEKGKKIAGVIRVDARRVDLVRTGGRYVEPVYGRPRRLQGDVIAVDPANRTLTVNAAIPFVAKLQKSQPVDQFKVGDFVAFECMPGASFTPA